MVQFVTKNFHFIFIDNHNSKELSYSIIRAILHLKPNYPKNFHMSKIMLKTYDEIFDVGIKLFKHRHNPTTHLTLMSVHARVLINTLCNPNFMNT